MPWPPGSMIASKPVVSSVSKRSVSPISVWKTLSCIARSTEGSFSPRGFTLFGSTGTLPPAIEASVTSAPASRKA